MIDVQCQCGTRLQLGDEWAGQQGRCPRCSQALSIPAAGPRPVEQAPAPQPEPARSATLPGPPQDVSSKANAKRRPNVAAPPPLPKPQPLPVGSQAKGNGPPREPTLAAPPSGTTITAVPPLTAAQHGLANKTARIGSRVNKSSARLILIASAAAGVVFLLLLGLGIGWALRTGEDADPQLTDNGATGAGSIREHRAAVDPPENDSDVGSTTVPAPIDATPLPTTDASQSSTSRPAAVNGHAANSVPPPVATPATAIEATLPRAAPKPPQGLSGVSREYDDLHCQRIQHQFGVRVPVGATIIEVDGEVLPLTDVQNLAESTSPYLLLPRGTHQVRFRPRERAVEITISEPFYDTFAAMRKFFSVEQAVRVDELLSRGGRAMDVHRAPFLLSFHGAAYASQDHWDAAERKFRRSLHVNPLFAPAHLNLAHCSLRRGDRERATRELMLADSLNIGNLYGIAPGIVQMRRELKLPIGQLDATAISVADYISLEPLSADDENLTALLEAISKYAVQDSERAKVLNNLGVHFADSGKPERALVHFRKALEALRFAGPERFALAKQVIGHMSQACRKAGFPEADEYDRMKNTVLP